MSYQKLKVSQRLKPLLNMNFQSLANKIQFEMDRDLKPNQFRQPPKGAIVRTFAANAYSNSGNSRSRSSSSNCSLLPRNKRLAPTRNWSRTVDGQPSSGKNRTSTLFGTGRSTSENVIGEDIRGIF